MTSLMGPRFRAAALASAAALLAAAGCVEMERGNTKMPEKQPEWVKPERLLVAIQLPEDTDANGYLDTLPLTVYLFDERYPLAVSVPGAFTFKLKTTAGQEIGTWQIEADDARAAVRKMRPGPGYQFRLDTRKFGADKRDSATVDMTAEFTPTEGKAIRGTSATTFRLGRAGV
jgi:hypothetical protein